MLSIMVAMDKNKGIGSKGKLPWRLPEDLAHFKRATVGSPVVMGRKTYESLPRSARPLPGRKNVVLTRGESFAPEGALVVRTPEEALAACEGENACVIGGAEVIQLFIGIADTLHLTQIDEAFDCDTFLDCFNEGEWELVSKEKGPKNEENPYDYYFTVWKKRL